MTTFPIAEVYARLCSMTVGHGRDEAVAALIHAEHYWQANADRCTVASLCWVGIRRVRQQVKRDRRIACDTDTVAQVAVARTESTSEGLDDLLAGLSGRDREIAALWSEGLIDTQVADRLGCSVKTVERTRKSLAATLSR